ncbi:rhomboid family intramembrane serine protease [Kibdelosporangium aridum]|uniref:Membrane associated serine protease, rhomboid family n=1 Tax=Kibdelosporangium aridum TaxID=2030 RepID=A0A1W2FRU5_KIBAR|nr:rhomboid family intramembrane serine protease [Kibdelosporangium aridum]SMD24338.1 Membrane associated serine protease, rhomboid family [Kibdelosporangium aridum]
MEPSGFPRPDEPRGHNPRPPKPPVPPAKRIIPPHPLQALIVVAGFVALLWAIEGIDTVLGGRLDLHGIWPREIDEWDGIIWAPLLHSGWDHLIANSVPFLVLGILTTAGGMGQFIGVTAIIWLFSGVGTFLIGAPGIHIGASGVVFGFLTFVLVRGLFVRSLPQILIAVVVFAIYGSVLWGVLPNQPGISWEGHLCGAVGGVVAAWLVGRSLKQASRPQPGFPG